MPGRIRVRGRATRRAGLHLFLADLGIPPAAPENIRSPAALSRIVWASVQPCCLSCAHSNSRHVRPVTLSEAKGPDVESAENGPAERFAA